MKRIIFLALLMSISTHAFCATQENLESDMEAAAKLNGITRQSDISQMKQDIAQLKRDMEDLKRVVREK